MTLDETRWQAVLARNSALDGTFVYAVSTTGVFCRPSCASRKPNRSNVEFFLETQQAQRAGYRPCLRCKPDEFTKDNHNLKRVITMCRLIEDSVPSPSLSRLAEQAQLSPSYAQRLFRSLVGITPKQYALSHRAEQARQQLTAGAKVTSTIYDAGFSSSGRFYETVPKSLGMSPSELRGGGSGVQIRFAVGTSYLGSTLVAATKRGVCCVTLGDEPRDLILDLQRRFPRAELTPGDVAFEDLLAQVISALEQPGAGRTLPLDIQGTVFQHRVWRALSLVPAGVTTTYSDLAASLGAPRATRAVASAVAKNPVAVLIPCHRVVRKSGALAGYRWGLDRKKDLLNRESALTPARSSDSPVR